MVTIEPILLGFFHVKGGNAVLMMGCNRARPMDSRSHAQANSRRQSFSRSVLEQLAGVRESIADRSERASQLAKRITWYREKVARSPSLASAYCGGHVFSDSRIS